MALRVAEAMTSRAVAQVPRLLAECRPPHDERADDNRDADDGGRESPQCDALVLAASKV